MLAVKHAGNDGKVASVYLHSPGGRTCTSNVVKTNLHQLQTYIFSSISVSSSVICCH